MSKTREQDTKAPGHYGNQGPQQGEDRSSGQDREEQYQRTKDQAPSDQDGQIANASATPDPDNNVGRETSGDREDRIRQRAHELWEQEGRPDGQAQEHWERAAQGLDLKKSEVDQVDRGSSGQR